jgi:DNA-binding transcriptional ArsR family regulator
MKGARDNMTRHTRRALEKLKLQPKALHLSIDLRRLQKNARAASALLTAMANESRLLLLCRISTGALSVGELAAGTDLSQSAVSQHLALLRRDGIVTTRRAGKSVYYSVCSAAAVAVLETLYARFCSTEPREVSKGSKRTHD